MSAVASSAAVSSLWPAPPKATTGGSRDASAALDLGLVDPFLRNLKRSTGQLPRHDVRSEKCLLQEGGLYTERALNRLDPWKRKRHAHKTLKVRVNSLQ